MSAIFFRELKIPETNHHLGIGSGNHGDQTGRMLMAIEKVLLGERPDWVLVYGDTNSTLAGALAAAKLHIPIAHVETGWNVLTGADPQKILHAVRTFKQPADHPPFYGDGASANRIVRTMTTTE